MTEDKYCTFCGAKNVSGNVFCENCGQSFEEQKDRSQQPSFQPYQPAQSQSTRTSISGSYDAVPGQQNPYVPHQRQGMPTFVKVILSIFFMIIPLLFFLFFYVFQEFPFP